MCVGVCEYLVTLFATYLAGKVSNLSVNTHSFIHILNKTSLHIHRFMSLGLSCLPIAAPRDWVDRSVYHPSYVLLCYRYVYVFWLKQHPRVIVFI